MCHLSRSIIYFDVLQSFDMKEKSIISDTPVYNEVSEQPRQKLTLRLTKVSDLSSPAPPGPCNNHMTWGQWTTPFLQDLLTRPHVLLLWFWNLIEITIVGKFYRQIRQNTTYLSYTNPLWRDLSPLLSTNLVLLFLTSTPHRVLSFQSIDGSPKSNGRRTCLG